MAIYTGRSEKDGHEALGVFINPNNSNEWSNKPYNKEQRQIVKDHRTYRELIEYMDGKYSLQDCYNQIKNKTFPLSCRLKRYVLNHYDEKGNFIG